MYQTCLKYLATPIPQNDTQPTTFQVGPWAKEPVLTAVVGHLETWEVPFELNYVAERGSAPRGLAVWEHTSPELRPVRVDTRWGAESEGQSEVQLLDNGVQVGVGEQSEVGERHDL